MRSIDGESECAFDDVAVFGHDSPPDFVLPAGQRGLEFQDPGLAVRRTQPVGPVLDAVLIEHREAAPDRLDRTVERERDCRDRRADGFAFRRLRCLQPGMRGNRRLQ